MVTLAGFRLLRWRLFSYKGQCIKQCGFSHGRFRLLRWRLFSYKMDFPDDELINEINVSVSFVGDCFLIRAKNAGIKGLDALVFPSPSLETVFL